MSIKISKKRFVELLRTILKKEIAEASTTATAGGEYDTPHAFSGKGKDRRKSIASGSGFEKVNEELQNSQGEQTDFKKGDVVKDINPDCPHVGSEGEVTKVGNGTITFKVTNNGKNYQEGDELEKTVDQMVKLKESVKEARTINVEPNWEGMWRFFKRMAKTNPRDWKKMERKLGGEWLKIDKMAQQKGWKSESVNESGIMYRAGVKKYGKEGMTKIQQAAGKKASHAKIGKIKDKYDKTREIPKEVTEDAKDVTKAKKLSQKLQNIEGRYRKVMYDLSDRLQADDKNHKLQDELIKSYTKNVTSFMRDMIKITKRVK